MNLDRDLRDALKPLRGDPVADAQRVLDALPVEVGRGPGRPPNGLPIAAWIAGGLALGVVIGLAIGKLFAGEPEPVEIVPPKDEQPKEDLPKDEQPKEDLPKDEQPKPPSESQSLMLMAFGAIEILEPKRSKETVDPGGYMVAPGTLFETNAGMAGLFINKNGVAVRLARQTIAAVEIDRIALRSGLVWLYTMSHPAPIRIDAEFATVLIDDAELMVGRRENVMTLTVLRGSATIRSAGGESRRIQAMQRCEIDAVGSIGSVATVPFAGAVTGWMAPMVLQQQDEQELYARIGELVDAYVAGTWRDDARLELRRFGARSVPALFKALDKLMEDPAAVHATAALIGELADYPRREWLLAMLERGDAETRAFAFRALDRVTGTEVEDEGFWRTAPVAERDAAALRWREILR